MSRQRDLLGQIADARAQMMMRGHTRLRLDMGPVTARRFAVESEIADIEDWCAAALNLSIRVTTNMEGFAIVARTD